jgi:hypothetical protein
MHSHEMSSHIMSPHSLPPIPPCPPMARSIMLYPLMPWPLMLCLIMPCTSMARPSFLALLGSVNSCPFLSCSVSSYHVTSCLVFSFFYNTICRKVCLAARSFMTTSRVGRTTAACLSSPHVHLPAYEHENAQ